MPAANQKADDENNASILPVAVGAMAVPGQSPPTTMPIPNGRPPTTIGEGRSGAVREGRIEKTDQAQTPESRHSGHDRREHHDGCTHVLEIERPGNTTAAVKPA